MTSIINKTSPEIFPKLLKKYDETLCELLELIRNVIISENVPEQLYLEVATLFLKEQKMVGALCQFGQMVN